jgi:uncharacterized protein
MRMLKAVLVATAMAAPLAGAAWAEGAQVTVTGEASVAGVPDMASLSLGVTTTGDTAAEAMAANTKALNAVMERLKAAGIAPRDMQTSNLSLNPNMTGYDSAQARIAGYTASNQLTVQIRALDSLGGVLDASIQDGANTLNGLSFGLTDSRPAMDKARAEAVADARAKAELLVKAAGANLGKIVSISESGGYTGPQPMFKAFAADSAAVPVAGGEVATTATVTVVFEIQQ